MPEATNCFENLPLAGYPIRSTTTPALSTFLEERLAASKKTVLLFANTNFVLLCQSMRSWLASQEVIIVNDGIGLDIAALLKHGHRYSANLNGTDFVPHLIKSCPARHGIFLLGGKPGVAEKAATVIERDLGHRVAGYLHGYSKTTAAEQCDQINRSGAQIVLVAMGNPLQEKWICENMDRLDATLFIGVGALFDFLSGAAQRAPRWIQRIRCEWLFRLYQEPRRLIRRYTLDIVRFLRLCLTYPTRTERS